jgi:PAS domain S-box-containing protein
VLIEDTARVADPALRATSLAYVRADRDGLIRDWNPAAERLFGWARDEVLGVALADTIVPAHMRSAHNAGFARRLAGDEGGTWAGTRVEVPARHRDGSELRVSMVVNALDGGFCAFISDRTDWHHAQQELQRSTTLVNAILEHTSAMISAKDLNGRYLFVNAQYARMFQVDGADLVGRHDSEVLPGALAAAVRVADEQVAESGSALTLSEEVPFGDEVRQYVVTRFPLVNPDGSIYGVCAIAIDDTARRRSEGPCSDPR